ncbi:MAG: SsrA-binding protein SmpB [Rickettsiales bacterium]|jgi:SsrA-binding protein|nr:SsrA-binding protein SmpB [Rickettsiales bacterium]
MPRQIIKTGQVAENRKARFEYAIEDTIESGLSLTGAEVKSLRYGLVNITDAFVQTSGMNARRGLTLGSDTNLVLSNMVVQPLPTANKAIRFDERRGRQLLMHRNQINRLIGKLNEKGATIVPLKLYFNNRGKLKVLLGVGFGKNKVDKRETIKRREWEKTKARVMRNAKA